MEKMPPVGTMVRRTVGISEKIGLVTVRDSDTNGRVVWIGDEGHYSAADIKAVVSEAPSRLEEDTEFRDLIDFTPDNLRSIISELLIDEIEAITVETQGKRLVVTDDETGEKILILVTAAKIDPEKERGHV